MNEMTVTLPETLRHFVETQAAARGYGDREEFVRDLIRCEQERVAVWTVSCGDDDGGC